MIPKANPKAQKDAIQTHGKARFTILTGSLIRMEYSDNGRFTDDASLVFINRELPLPEYERCTEGKDIVIRTKHLELRYKTNSGAFTAENLSIRLLNFSPETIWTPGKQDANNLMGTTSTLDETNGAADLELEQGIISRSGWSLIDDSRTPLLDDTDWQWVKARSGKQAQDWYFFGYGHRYLEALADYCRVAGKIPLPPRFAFGYWWSRYWAYSDEELRALIKDFALRGLPLDVLVIDMDWHKTEGLSRRNPQTNAQGELIGWSGYTWNKDLFPHPAQFIEHMQSRGIKIALNLHPASGIAKDEEHYDDFAAQYRRKPSKDGSYPYALEDKRWAEAYFAAIIDPLENEGVDFWWLDWQAWQESRLIAGLSNIWWLNHVFFMHMRKKSEQRPLLFHRWGGLGNHRYQIGFSGDTMISWKSLANLPAFTATAGNVCYGYWSHDIGGHMGGPGSPELYLRWLQYGALSPIMRTHATKDKDLERRIWMFPDQYDAMRDALMLRHALAPYLYSAARRAYDEGVSICRPLYWFHPESDEAYRNPQEYYFGDDIIAAPITQAADDTGLAFQSVWLPPGKWYDVCRGSLMDGGISARFDFALNEIPMFVRAGAIIPLLPEDKTSGRQSDRYILNFYPGADGETVLYEDDGSTDRYITADHARTRITQKYSQRRLKIMVSPTKGSFEGMPPKVSYQLNVIGRFPPRQVLVGDTVLPYAADLKEGHWSYDGSRLAIRIMPPSTSRGKSLECNVIFTAQADARLGHLNGIPGILKRLPEAVCVLKKELNRFDQIANLPAAILSLGATAARLNYNPRAGFAELTSFPERLRAAVACIVEFEGSESIVLERIIKMISLHRTIPASPRIVFKNAGSQTLVDIRSSDSDVEIRYTIDSSLPTPGSTLFRKPILFKKMAVITARAYAPGCLPGLPVSSLLHYNWAKKIAYVHPNSPLYDGGGAKALANGSLGNRFDHRVNWVGFEGTDAIIEIELMRTMVLKGMQLRFLRDQSKWIFYPGHLSIEISPDGVNYQRVFRRNLQTLAYFPVTNADILTVSAVFKHNERSRYVRVNAKSIGICPAWHPGSGGKAWIFMDEILIAEG